MIFESRPNVITEAFSLAFKSGNSILLRGGKESKNTAHEIYQLITSIIAQLGFEVFYGIEDYEHRLVGQLLLRSDLIDVTIPRGGDGLIDFVTKTARMPIIKNDRGMCHVYVDSEADLSMAVRIVVNSKTQRPGVCNSMETLLVHSKVAKNFLPELSKEMQKFNLKWHVDQEALKILKPLTSSVELATLKDWNTEYLDLIMNVAIVDSAEAAVDHITKYGSKHSEAIVTQNESTARNFQFNIDAAVVYWNASTRFTDGFQFGLGGELGISTQKIHVRGPVGLNELTSCRWLVDGTGQVRS
jgi:glutamate-5-semialdehyde dehydrogenase